mgnify:CR=1 FL=1
MREYWTSDYAVNKDSKNIVYQFADGRVEITMEDYLKANPEKTEADFIQLKKLSDELFYEQGLEDTRYGKRKQTLGLLENSERFATPAPDTILTRENEEKKVLAAAEQLFEGKELTEVQERRFRLHFFKGLSYRQIASLESVHFTSVQESIEVATRKLKRNFNYF